MDKSDPPIRVGSIVRVGKAWWDEIGIVIKENVWEPGGLLIAIPGLGEVERSLDLCYNATEDERKKYFLEKLKHGSTI